MFFDPLYWVVVGVGMALSLWAQFRVKTTFAKYSQLAIGSGMTGADVAKSILRANDIRDVSVEPVQGALTDHYDPRHKVLRLSEPVFAGRSMAAAGIAAHEVGHAIQHATGNAWLKFRSAWVPVANLGGGISMFVIIAALFLGGTATVLGGKLAILGVALFATTTVFTLVTLPVEFDASRRALATLQQGGLMSSEELGGAKKVLDAAAMTYIAAAATSLLTLLYWAAHLGLFGGRRD
jgi:Zn-dependent membrane protease YugP